MKVFPTLLIKETIDSEDKKLTGTEKATRGIALLVAIGTVGFFFFKILFF